MAKVYDALKRLEQERSKETHAPAVASVAELEGSAPAQPMSIWRRWFGGAARRADALDRRSDARLHGPSEDFARVLGALDEIKEQLPRVGQDLLQAVDSRLADMAGRERATAMQLSEMEHNILQNLDTRLGEFGKQFDRRALAAVDRLGGRLERLRSRQSLLLGITAAILLLVLLH